MNFDGSAGASTLPRADVSPAHPVPDDAPSDRGAVLSLIDFLDMHTLQELQDGFAVLTRLTTVIRDAQGQPLTAPTDAAGRDESDRVLQQLIDGDEKNDEQWHTAPIVVGGQTLGSITIEQQLDAPGEQPPTRLRELAKKLGVNSGDVDALIVAAEKAGRPNRAAGVQFLHLMANSIARLCYQEHHLRRRVEELSALYRFSHAFSRLRDVDQIMQTATRELAQVMNAKASSIRLLSDEGALLRVGAVHNLSQQYLSKGPVRVEQTDIFKRALTGQVVHVQDMQNDPAAIYRDDAKREGLVSMLCAGIVHRGRPIGVIQLYSGQPRHFSAAEVELVQAIVQLLAAAIHSARADRAHKDHRQIQRQLQLARKVQQRMMPAVIPDMPPFDVAARYVPSLELSGDFYDIINLEGHFGVVIGDVVGKGVAASLLMASVRASLRAYAQDIYDLDEVLARVNVALSRDTRDNEFATLFYGVLDPATRRLTYCNAGHNPPMLLRDGEITDLDVGGMIVGADSSQQYNKGLIDLLPGDMLLLYTDGLIDAMNFDEQRFGLDRVITAFREVAHETAHVAVNHILWEMRRFAGLNTRTDDTTLLVIKVN